MNQGLKFDSDKPPMHLLDRQALEQLARVLEFGAKKYAAHNWRKGLQFSRLISAALRHLHAFNDGEDVDAETGLSHVDHAACCLMFLSNMAMNRPDMDDRHRPVEPGEKPKETFFERIDRELAALPAQAELPKCPCRICTMGCAP